MAFFSTIIRRTAAATARSVGAIGTQRSYSSKAVVFTWLKTYRAALPSSTHNFSSFAKKSSSPSSSSSCNLVRVLDSEIKCAEESVAHAEVDGMPDGFAFKIEDDPGTQSITLVREYQGEIIKVEVHMPDVADEEEEVEEKDVGDNDDDDDEGSNENRQGGQSTLAMVVSVSKGKKEPCLEFGCTAYQDEVTIDCLTVKDPDTSDDDLAYEGPDFSELDENLQKAFYKYLEDRGIKASTTNFLFEYMFNKDNREYTAWLKNVKNFIQK